MAIFVVKTLGSLRAGEARWGWGRLAAPASFLPKRLALFGLTVAYIVFLPWGGYTITGFVYLYAAMVLLGGTKVRWKALWVALAFTLGGYLLFVVAFQTRFPEGPFEHLMKGLF